MDLLYSLFTRSDRRKCHKNLSAPPQTAEIQKKCMSKHLPPISFTLRMHFLNWQALISNPVVGLMSSVLWPQTRLSNVVLPAPTNEKVKTEMNYIWLIIVVSFKCVFMYKIFTSSRASMLRLWLVHFGLRYTPLGPFTNFINKIIILISFGSGFATVSKTFSQNIFW